MSEAITATPEAVKEALKNYGWGMPALAKKFHCFKEGEAISLCRRWMFTGYEGGDTGKADSLDCKVCTKKLVELVPGARPVV